MLIRNGISIQYVSGYVSTVVASHRIISRLVDQVNDQSPKVLCEIVPLRLFERMYTLDAWNGLDKDAKLDVTTD